MKMNKHNYIVFKYTYKDISYERVYLTSSIFSLNNWVILNNFRAFCLELENISKRMNIKILMNHPKIILNTKLSNPKLVLNSIAIFTGFILIECSD